ncbi:MAG: hypothetical protein LBO00_07885 [Zoogloeaceae bacterium]|jgi:hypothetical protein|nr:hypothetical protein [Zoogloeaceae bacterium]
MSRPLTRIAAITAFASTEESGEESGKTIYFCVRYENAKGEPGPWGPIFSAVIP